MKKYVIYLAIGFLSACAHSPHLAQNKAAEQAFEELREFQRESLRHPSSIERPRPFSEIHESLSGLKSYEYLVFAKLNDQAEKNNSSAIDPKVIAKMTSTQREVFFDSLTDYASPKTFAFSTQRNVSCSKLKKEKSKFKTEVFFKDADDKSDINCLVIRGFQKSPDIKKANIKKDDVLEVQFYIDEYLRPFGQVLSIANGERVNFRTEDGLRKSAIKLDPNQNLSSGLILFPIDYPNFAGYRQDGLKSWTEQVTPLSIPQDEYVRAKISQYSDIEYCKNGYKAHYKNQWGATTRVGWCAGHALPTTIHTERYFAILRKISN